MSIRHVVADHIRARLASTGAEDITVLAHRPAALGNITGPTIIVGWDEITPGRVPGSWYDATLKVYLTTGKQQPGPADDEIDNLLSDVIWALEGPDDGIRWTTGKRVVIDDQTWPGWELTIETTTTKPEE